MLTARAGDGDRVEPRAVGAGLDVEREDPEARSPDGGRDHGVVVDAADAGPALERAVDRERPAQVVIDEPAIGEPEIGLEACDPGIGEAAAQRRHVARQRDLDASDRLTGERPQCGGSHRGADDPLRIARGHEEIGHEPIVDHQRRLAALQHRVQVDDGSTAVNPVSRRQDEAALGHDTIIGRCARGVYASQEPAAASPPAARRRSSRGR